MDQGVLVQLQSLPDSHYLEFCQRYLLLEAMSQCDPFSIVVPDACLKNAYVHRAEADVERAVLESPSLVTFMLGPRGRGKTTLMQVTRTRGLSEQALIVRIPIAFCVGRLFNGDSDDQNAGLRLRQAILRNTFIAFWDVLRQPDHYQPYLTGRRQDVQWMDHLRWVYQHLGPIRLPPLDDFVLMDWFQIQLTTTDPHSKISPIQLLHELASVITAPPSRSYGASPSRYHRTVLIFLDTDFLSYPEIMWLIQEGVLRLSIELPESCRVVLLLDSEWEHKLLEVMGWSIGKVALYKLPAWTKSDLEELLRLRLVAHGQDPNLPTNWGSTLLSEHLKPEAQRILVNEIASSAVKAAGAKGNWFGDAPIHALWLARWVVTKLATSDEESIPASADQIRRYIREYLDGLALEAE